MKERFFVENKNKFVEKNQKHKYLLEGEVTYKEIEKGIILPAKKKESNAYQGTFKGGVVDKKFKFISGHKRNVEEMNMSIEEGYKVRKKEIKYCDETVVYGGILLMSSFGHLVLESLSRLWYYVDNPNCNYKVAFLKIRNLPDYSYGFLEILGIPKERVIIIEEPTQFKNVIVPDETIHAWLGYKNRYIDIYDAIRKNVKPAPYKKVYLTRTKLKDIFDVNEKFFEDFYRRRGFEIVSTETLSIRDQVSIMAGAEEVVTTCGTLSHMVLFSKKNVKLTILNRNKNDISVPQAIVNEARKVDYYFVDALLDVLPSRHVNGCVCLYPTKYFEEYLKSTKVDYNKSELECNKEKVVYEYLEAWTNNYSMPNRYQTIQEMDIYCVLEGLNKFLFNNDINRKDYDKKAIGSISKSEYIKFKENLIENPKNIKKLYKETKRKVRRKKIKNMLKSIITYLGLKPYAKKVYNKLRGR